MRNHLQFWTSRTLTEERIALCRIGPLNLWLRRDDQEWGVASERVDSRDLIDFANVPADVVPENLEWSYMGFRKAPHMFQLRPVVPDRPLVVKPARPLTIPRGESTSFCMAFPVWIEVVIGENAVIAIIPTELLSDTWFGNQEEGELAYATGIAAERYLKDIDLMPHYAVCEVETSNTAKDDLQFEKLCLRTQHIALYSGTRHLWSSPVKISYEGKMLTSAVSYDMGPPKGEEGLKLLAAAHRPAERALTRLTFNGSFTHDFKGKQR